MRVPVIFANGERGIVSSFDLDDLLEENFLLAFYRPEGWVRVDCSEAPRTGGPASRERGR